MRNTAQQNPVHRVSWAHCVFLINPSGAEASWNVPSPCVARTSAVKVLTMQDKQVLVISDEGLQLPASSSAVRNHRKYLYILCFRNIISVRKWLIFYRFAVVAAIHMWSNCSKEAAPLRVYRSASSWKTTQVCRWSCLTFNRRLLWDMSIPVKVTLHISGTPIENQWGSRKYPG